MLFRSKVRTSTVAVVAAVAAVALTSACSSDSGGSTDSNGMTTVTIAYPAPVADHMVQAVTAEAGLFKKYGINAKIQFLQQSELVPAMVAGKVQFASLAAPGYDIASLNGSTIQSIARWEDSFDVLFVSNPKYPTMKSLDGKSVAISSPGAFSDLVAKIAMRKYGITLTERPLGNNSNSLAAFQTGSVDSMASLSPNQFDQVNQKLKGVHKLVDFREVKGVPAISFVGAQSWMQSHKDTTIKVLKGLNDGFTYFKTHKAAAVKVIAKLGDLTPAQASAGYDDTIKAMSPTLEPSVSAEKTVLGYLAADYPKAKGFDASKLVDASYLKAAQGK